MIEKKKLDIKKIKSNLKTSFLGKNIVYHEEIDSTQDEAKRLVKQGKATNGMYIVTDNQTKGKGTKGRAWYGGEYENICGTFVLTPNCNIKQIENLTILIAQCLVKTIKDLYDIKLDIKYPNDVMCNRKKVSGILTESVTNKEIVKYVFIGIGINVNQIIFTPEIEQIATSLKKEYNKEFNREEIISSFFNTFEKEYKKLIN